MELTTVTVRLSSEVKNKLDLLAERTRRSKSFLAAEAIEGYVARELEIVVGIERGLEDVRSGRVVPHDEAMRTIRATIGKVRSAKPGGSSGRRTRLMSSMTSWVTSRGMMRVQPTGSPTVSSI